MDSIEILSRGMGHVHSVEFEYDKDENGKEIYPLRNPVRIYKYVDIGNNIEVDSLGCLGSEHRVFAYVHLRNVKEVNKYVLNDVVVTIVNYIKNNVLNYLDRMDQDSKVSWQEFYNGLPDDFKLNLSNVNFDPGFSGHRTGEERDTGIRYGSFTIHYSDIYPEEQRKFMENEMSLKALFYDPSIYKDRLRLPDVTIINHHLSQAHAQRNILKKLQIKLDWILKNGGQFKVRTDEMDPIIYQSHKDNLIVSFNYEGKTPTLDYNVRIKDDQHGFSDKKTIVNAKMGTFPKDSENGFFLHVPSNMVEVIRTSYNNQDDKSQSFNDIMTHFEIDEIGRAHV